MPRAKSQAGVGKDTSKLGFIDLVATSDPNTTSIGVHALSMFTYDDCDRLGKAVAKNTSLKILKYQCGYQYRCDPLNFVDFDKVKLFSRGLARNRSIEVVEFDPEIVVRGGKDVLRSMKSFFKNNYNIVKLRIMQRKDLFSYHSSEEEEPDEEATWRNSIDVLKSVLGDVYWLKFISFEFFYYSDWTSDVIKEFCPILNKLPHLEELRLIAPGDMCTSSLSNVGYPALSELLRNPRMKVTRLVLEFDEIESDVFTAFINDLRDNQQLTDLKIRLTDTRYFTVDTDLIRSHLLETLRFWNHSLDVLQLEGIGEMGDEVHNLVRINSIEDKKAVRLRKSLDYAHLFDDRQISEEPFDENEFDIELLPHILWSISSRRNKNDGRCENSRWNALYHFVRSKPLLVVEADKVEKRKPMPVVKPKNIVMGSNNENMNACVKRQSKRKRTGGEMC